MLFDIDWVTLVFVALLIYFFGKAEFYKGKIEASSYPKDSDQYIDDKNESDTAMTYFGIFCLIFTLSILFPDQPNLQELIDSIKERLGSS